MAIDIRCENISGFDDATQVYEICNQKIRVPKNRMGTVIKCPKCKQAIAVPGEESTSSESVAPPSSGNSINSMIPQRRDVMEMEFPADAPVPQPFVFATNKERCPKCGGIYTDDGICSTCNYVEPVRNAEKREKSKTPAKPAGFQLWLMQIANEGVSIPVIGYVCFGMTTLFCGLVMLWGILSTSFVGVAMTIVAAFVLIFCFMVLGKTRQIASDNSAPLGVLAPFWNTVLKLARWMEWQKYDASLNDRNIIDLRSKPISDMQLVDLDGLKSCHVLDLENSNITDAGLKFLYGLPKLHCLVLRNTRVSRGAVAMLQQHNRRLWIWV